MRAISTTLKSGVKHAVIQLDEISYWSHGDRHSSWLNGAESTLGRIDDAFAVVANVPKNLWLVFLLHTLLLVPEKGHAWYLS